MYKRLAASICFLSIILFYINPSENIANVSAGILIWATSVLPALFPFFFLSKLLIELDAFGGFSRLMSRSTKKLFNAPPAASYIFLLSIVCGYPLGAKLSAEFYEKRIFDTDDCTKLATFCSTGGPIFILGTVGGLYLNSASAGLIILVSHILGALINGLLYRKKFVSKNQTIALISPPQKTSGVLSDCMQNSLIGVITVGGFVTLFYMWSQMLLSLPFLDSAGILTRGIVSGLLEVTAGCKILSQAGNPALAAILSCCLISFGGLCIFLQSFVFYKSCGVKSSMILLFKITQATFSTALCTPLALILL